MNTAMSKLLLFLLNSYEKGTWYDLALYLLLHLNEISTITLNGIAAKCGTSVPTVTRFCRMLGYANFTGLKEHLQSTLEIRRHQTAEKLKVFDEAKTLAAIETLCGKPADAAALKEMARQIAGHRRIYLIGAVHPQCLALDLAEDLLEAGIAVIPENIEHFDFTPAKEDYCIIVTLTGRFFMLNSFPFSRLRENGAGVGVISGYAGFDPKEFTPCVIFPCAQESFAANPVLLLIYDLIYYYFVSFSARE